MSTRQMRRLRKQQEELQTLQKTEADHLSEESEQDPAPPKPRSNAFAGFAALADDVGDDDNDSAEDDIEEHVIKEPISIKPTADNSTPSKRSKKSKKKKGKKGKKGDTNATPDAPEEKDDSIDEIDRAIKELKLSQPQQNTNSGGKWVIAGGSYDAERLCALLQVNFQHLKAINEMRKVFGREAIDAAMAEDAAQETANLAERIRQQRVDLETYLRGHPSKPMSDVVLKRNPFIDGKKSWPNDSTAGLTMKAVSNADDIIVEYTFAHEKIYDQLEREFFHLVQTYDPMNIVHFLYKHPYHVSSLIQVSKIAKQDQNSALSAELCERALFTFGRVALSSFRKKLEHGQARLDFRRPENRQFYLAGYNYIKNLIRKGTYRTALEWTKLFLGVNSHDPYGMVNWLHVLAIRAHEAQWFVDICDSDLLKEAGISTSLYIKQTLVLARLQLNDRQGAKALLIDGMEQLPWLFAQLFSQLNLDIPKSIWGAQPRDENEELHTALYIHMAMDLWNNPQTTEFLVEAAKAAEKVNASSLPPAPPVSLGTARFIYLDDTPSMLGLVPRVMMDVSPNFDFDPLPPSEKDNIFSSDVQKLPWLDHPLAARDVDYQDIVNVFERHVNRGPGGDREVGEGLEAAIQAINNAETADAPGRVRDFIELIRAQIVARDVPIDAANLPEVDTSQMPGAWEDVSDSDSDEEMPPLIETVNARPWYHQLFARGTPINNQDQLHDDDEMPGLIPLDSEVPTQAAETAQEGHPDADHHARVEDADDEDD